MESILPNFLKNTLSHIISIIYFKAWLLHVAWYKHFYYDTNSQA